MKCCHLRMMFAVAGKTALPPESRTRNLVPSWAGAGAGGGPFPGWEGLVSGVGGTEAAGSACPSFLLQTGCVFPLVPGAAPDGDLGKLSWLSRATGGSLCLVCRISKLDYMELPFLIFMCWPRC